MKQTAEEILREYVTFEDVNQSETVELLPLTIVDAMEEYADQYTCDETRLRQSQEDIKKLKLEILESVKLTFEIHSDYSTTCNGYKSLCNQIDTLKNI